MKEVDKDGKTTYSNVLFVKLSSLQTFSILQNPAQNILQVETNQTGTFSIYDFSGRKIQTVTAQTGNQNIDIVSLSSGVYVLQMITSNGSLSSKVFMKK